MSRSLVAISAAPRVNTSTVVHDWRYPTQTFPNRWPVFPAASSGPAARRGEVGQGNGADCQQFRSRWQPNYHSIAIPVPYPAGCLPNDHQRAGHVNNSRISTPKFGFSTLGLAALMFLTLLVMPASVKAATTVLFNH